ncbi:hypothetical protein EYC59_05280 [Candidatus Saccharibacteria bacterium]|nr:MAG: hypothetical protein EYC59_05280 [Candidatus Saccharibacteria bacterium]
MIFSRNHTNYQKQKLRAKRKYAGDTIVEVLIAVAVISFILAGAFSISMRSTSGVRDAQERSEALKIASTQVEWLRGHNGLPNDGSTCYDQAGAATNGTANRCNYTTGGDSGCDGDAETYCYRVVITAQAAPYNPLTDKFISTTYTVTVTWDSATGHPADSELYYRLPVLNASYTPPAPPSPPSPPTPPTPPGPIPVVIAQIDVGNYHVCANSQAGNGYCWGKNDFGALGDGTNNNRHAPNGVSEAGVLAGKTIVSTSAGYNHTCVVDSLGKVYCWGYNSQGQLGNGASGTTNNPNPTAVITSGPMGSKVIVKVNGGDSHTCALSQDGDIFCWGGNIYGQIGDGSTTNRFTPAQVTNSGPGGNKTWVDVSAGYQHTCGLTSNGTAYCWGFNGHGQLGTGNNSDNSVPQPVATALKFKQISAGDEHTCAVTLAGALYCWGYNNDGQLGIGTMLDTNVPTAVNTSGVLGGKNIARVAAGYRHTCAIGDGDIYCWGNNNFGQLGNGVTSSPQLSPVAVVNTGAMGGRSMADIATGRYTSCAVSTLASGGGVYCWGANDDGQLGDNKYPVNSNVPSLVTFP